MASDRFSELEKNKLRSSSEAIERFEHERSERLDTIAQLDLKVVEIRAIHGAIYNKNAPILKLPAEITCLIFAFACVLTREEDYPDDDEDEEVEGPVYIDKYLMAVVVSHVCHQWRTIALAFPSLWSSFCYEASDLPRVPVDRLSAYLERSQPQPLELYLDVTDTKNKPLHLVMLQKVVAHVERWKRVTILANDGAPFSFLVPLLHAIDAPMLEYLSVCLDIPDFEDSSWYTALDLHPTIFTGGAPKLKSVWLDGSTPYVCLPPLFNVTTLRIEELNYTPDTQFSWRTLLDILAIPTLENLSLAGSIFKQPTTHALNVIDMHNLQHLRYTGNNFLNYVLLHLRAPRLETLTIQGTSIAGQDMSFWTIHEPYFFPSLQKVALVESILTEPGGDFPFAYLFSSVQELLLSYRTPVECISHYLAQLKDPVVKMWPNLKVVTCNFDGTQVDPTYPQVLIDIAKWRGIRSMKYRVRDEHVERWRRSTPFRLELLEAYCTIEEIDSDVSLTRYWPLDEQPSGCMFADVHHDPFAVDEYD